MNKLTKEFLYFLLTLFIAFLIVIPVFGIENIKNGELILSIHSTYFVIKLTHFLIVYLPLFVSISYLIRIIVLKFENYFSNLIYLISNGLLIFILIIFLFNSLNSGFKANNNFWAFLIVLLTFEIYVLFKTEKLK